MISSHTIVDRYLSRKAALSEDKLKEVMLKIRKGATSSLTWGSLREVLANLDPGWKLEPITSLVKLQGNDFYGKKDEVEDKYKELGSKVVTTLPHNPKHGQFYITNLTPVQENPHHLGDYFFKLNLWMGHDGWKITAPNGKVFETPTEEFDLSSVGSLRHGYKTRTRGKLSLSNIERWLNEETDWIDQINKKLGLGKFEPSISRTRENTGTCPVCFQNIKANPYMVLHGYRRPGTGETYGRCYGVGYLPFEVSIEGTKDYLEKVVEPQLEQTRKRFQDLKSGKITKLKNFRIEITSDSPQWERVLSETIRQTEWEIKQLEEKAKAYKNLVQYWKERPLPKEGEPHINWYHQGQKG
jgi:hypothetical protein